MYTNHSPHLCGSILFNLLLESRKNIKNPKMKIKEGSDNLSVVDTYLGFMRIFTGEISSRYYGDSIKKIASQYKNCDANTSIYIPITQQTTISTFQSLMKNNKFEIYSRINDFKCEFLNEDKCEWLIRALIEIIQQDICISNDKEFEVAPNIFVKKINLNKHGYINFLTFMGSVLLYVVSYASDATSGKATFEEWYTRPNARSAWVFTAQLGNPNIEIKIDFSNPLSNDNPEKKDDKILFEAKKFCIKYEKEKKLLPLCQISNFIDPIHKNTKQIYDDFNMLSSDVQKEVIKMCGLPILDFSNNQWISDCISKYKNDIVLLDIATNDIIHYIDRYLHLTYHQYSRYRIGEYERYIFKRPLKYENKYISLKTDVTSLISYIDDYIYCKNNKIPTDCQNPWEYLKTIASLNICPEEDLTFWLCKFIIDSSFRIICNEVVTDKSWLRVDISADDIDTQDELYYWVLLRLYILYKVDRKPFVPNMPI